LLVLYLLTVASCTEVEHFQGNLTARALEREYAPQVMVFYERLQTFQVRFERLRRGVPEVESLRAQIDALHHAVGAVGRVLARAPENSARAHHAGTNTAYLETAKAELNVRLSALKGTFDSVEVDLVVAENLYPRTP
jgi:DNA repair ATPase RecN